MTTATREEFTFQTEIKQLLNILSHSLYQNREIAVRELVSNASDSLNKLRHIQLSEAEYRDDAPLKITLLPDATAKTLTIVDNGVGLTREELIENLGTIAHSGSLDFMKKAAEAKAGTHDSDSSGSKSDLSLIGQFGVGFYAAFMLADTVEVITRSYREESGWKWTSDGTGQYSIEPVDEAPRGAQIVLHLKEDAIEEFTKEYRLESIVRRYSTFVPHAVYVGEKHVNNQPPIWVEPKSQVTPEQYKSFYQWLTHHANEEPLWHLHLSADSPLQFQSILYCPPVNLELQGFGRLEHGLTLCAKRILVQDDNKDLLPDYLHFVYGLVDSADLPLNVSRETLQDNRLIPKLRKVLTKKVLDYLAELAEEQPATYAKFYEQFGMVLRGGVGVDFENREKIARLLRLASSHDVTPGATTSLGEYVKRMREDQTQIYYLGGPDLASLLRNPHYETFRDRGLEVLFLTDPVDEFALSHLQEFDGKSLVSIDSADIQLPASAESPSSSTTGEEQGGSSQIAPAGFDRVLEIFRQALGERVQDVRKATRLATSPVCLVNPQGSMSSQLQKVLSQTVKDFNLSRRILEVNPQAPLIGRLATLSSSGTNDDFIADCGLQLYASAMLLDGLVVEPDLTADRMRKLMEEAADKRTVIIT